MKRHISALAAGLLLALTGGVTDAWAQDLPVAPVAQPTQTASSVVATTTAPVTQPTEPAAQQAPAAPAAQQPAAPAAQPVTANQPVTKTATTSNTPVTGQSQTGPGGPNHDDQSQENEATQVAVPVASPATQVSAGNNVQVLTLGSRNGDVENNNQSQELEQSNESSGQTHKPRSGGACCNTNHVGGNSQSRGEGQENEATQVSVPVASPATQVSALNNVQVLTLGSRNGDVENNNQSQELEQENENKGSSAGHDGCNPCSPAVRGGSGRGGSEGQENEATQVLVPVASPATQVSALNNVQVLTLGSRNGDVENNNQSQELEQENTSKGSGGPNGCNPCSPMIRNGSGGRGSEGQENEADQWSVPVLSPATQVSLGNNVQVLTLHSQNGDVENNNQSQELEQENTSKGSGGPNGGPPARGFFSGDGSGHGSDGQENEATQVLVPILSPATQVSALNNVQVLTLGSRNGDVENNNQSQELEQENTSKGSGGTNGCNPCGPTTRGFFPGGGHGSEGQENEADQWLVPIASPATQVSALNNVQVLTLGSRNGDVENNNQSQELEQENTSKGSGGHDGCNPGCNGNSSPCENYDRCPPAPCGPSGGSGGQENEATQVLVPILSPATQVSALNNLQVLTLGSRNGDVENNNQSQELEQSNTTGSASWCPPVIVV